MNVRRQLSARIPAMLASLLLVAIFLFLVDRRPTLPSVPRSFSGPLALWQLEEILVFLGWLASLALLLALLVLTARTIPRPLPPRIPHVLRRDADRGSERRARLAAALPRVNPLAKPYVLTVAAPSGTDAQPSATRAAPAATLPAHEVDEPAHEQHRSAVAIRVLGPPTIEGLPRRRRGLRTDCRLFLIYLALHRNGAGRDELIAALWPDAPEQKARQRLYQAAADARSGFGDAFVTQGDVYRLDREQLNVDVDELERLLREADIAADGQREEAALEQALELVRGNPLAGVDLPSLDGEARRLSAVVVDLCDRLAQVRLSGGDSAGALAAAERGIELDELNENLWRIALEAEGALGLREALISRYDALSRLLDERLGLEPQRETRSVYRQLLAQD